MKPRTKTARLRDQLYGERPEVDTMAAFRHALDHRINPESVVLDLGAGAGENNAYDLKGRVARVVGIDNTDRVLTNPLLDEAFIGDAGSMEFPDDTFDMVFCVFVLEHVESPVEFLRSVRRVLKPGGSFLALTPNKFHYVSTAARMTPTRFHKWVLGRAVGRRTDDTFATYYRMNTPASLRGNAQAAGLQVRRISMIEGYPGYMAFSVPTLLAAAAYERTVSRYEVFSPFRSNIIVEMEKGA